MSVWINIPDEMPRPIAEILTNIVQNSPSSEADAVADAIASAFEGNEPDDPYEYAANVAQEIAGWAHAVQTEIMNAGKNQLCDFEKGENQGEDYVS